MKILVVLFFLSISLFASNQCEFTSWKSHRGTSLRRHISEDAYIYTSSYMGIDADGAPNAYHRDNDLALDYLANAGHTGRWWGIVTTNGRMSGTPYVQESGEFAGYYVSNTWLEDTSKSTFDTARYVDSTKIPYIVFPGNVYDMRGTGGRGDFGYAINLETGDQSPFIVADKGPANNKLGEVSIALATRLGGDNPNPKNGAGIPSGEILYVVFPGSHNTPRWNGSLEDLEAKSERLLDNIGGMSSVLECESMQECQNECDEVGKLSCSGDRVVKCVSKNGCLKKETKVACNSGFTCSDNQCVAKTDYDDGTGNHCSYTTSSNNSFLSIFLFLFLTLSIRRRDKNLNL